MGGGVRARLDGCVACTSNGVVIFGGCLLVMWGYERELRPQEWWHALKGVSTWAALWQRQAKSYPSRATFPLSSLAQEDILSFVLVALIDANGCILAIPMQSLIELITYGQDTP